MTHIHGAGDTIQRRFDLVVYAGGEVFRELVILVRSDNKSFNRQTHFKCYNTAHHIPEVTGRNREDHLFIRLTSSQFRKCIEIIYCLWDQSSNINRICRRKIETDKIRIRSEE